jgi:hypothetical protein
MELMMAKSRTKKWSREQFEYTFEELGLVPVTQTESGRELSRYEKLRNCDATTESLRYFN